MKITKQQLKKLIEQELKEIEYGFDGAINLDANIEDREPRKKVAGRQDPALADTAALKTIERDGTIQDLSKVDQGVYSKVSISTGDIFLTPEEREAIRQLIRQKYNLPD